MRARGQVFAHVDWRRMDESQLDGMRYVAYTPTGVVDGRFAPMPTRNVDWLQCIRQSDEGRMV